jgi:hypothetical protein
VVERKVILKFLTIVAALVWFVNGFICKILNLIPRHQLIVARILGDDYAPVLTKTIGLLEILMAIWILSGMKSKLCTLLQILLIASMNILEFMLVPDLLLFGKFNSVIAMIFIILLIWRQLISDQLKYTTA